jgi:tRNA-intron endonuclease
MPVRKTAKKTIAEVEMAPKEEKPARKPLGTAIFTEERVLLEINDETKEIVENSAFGTKISGKKYQLSLLEALFLSEKKKLIIHDSEGKPISFDLFVQKAKNSEPNFWIRYSVFRDLRSRGYIVKTALKFGADFRVYDRGVKPGDDHARWVVYAVHEGQTLTWHEFAAKNRVAHSTKKRLLIGILDDEDDVTYYEIRWIRP